jgi:osmotically-inducible protein OsmY
MLVNTIKDEALAQRIREALAQDKRLGGLPMMIRAANGEIWLKGRVENQEQIDLAVTVIQGIPGVRQVYTDELSVWEESE